MYLTHLHLSRVDMLGVYSGYPTPLVIPVVKMLKQQNPPRERRQQNTNVTIQPCEPQLTHHTWSAHHTVMVAILNSITVPACTHTCFPDVNIKSQYQGASHANEIVAALSHRVIQSCLLPSAVVFIQMCTWPLLRLEESKMYWWLPAWFKIYVPYEVTCYLLQKFLHCCLVASRGFCVL